MGRHNNGLRGWRKRRKAKRKLQRKVKLSSLKWNKVCNVYRSESSPRFSDLPSPETLELDYFAATSTTTEQRVTTVEKNCFLDEDNSNKKSSERDTDSLVYTILAYSPNSSGKGTILSETEYRESTKKPKLFSNDPLYVNMLKYNSHTTRLEKLKAKALKNLDAPFY